MNWCGVIAAIQSLQGQDGRDRLIFSSSPVINIRLRILLFVAL